MQRYFIVAGDPSGDMHSARLMNSLKLLQPSAEFTGIGGKKMQEAGLIPIAPFEKMSIVGFWEVAKNYSYIKKVLNKCRVFLENENINAFIPVDYPGFNLRLSKIAKKNHIPVIYYIAPQLWAWGKNRAKNLADNVDLLLSVFPFETNFFKSYGINVKFVGHPLLDSNKFSEDFPGMNERDDLIALLPGSRKQEIQMHLPLMEKIADRFIKNNPEYKICVSVSENLEFDIYEKTINNHPEWITFTDSIELMMKAKAGIVKTGTSNLEAALCGMPFVMIYKTSMLSYMLGKRLVNLEFLSLVNILTGQKIINEYIQNDINMNKIVSDMESLVNNEKAEKLQNIFKNVKSELGQKGASDEAAKQILDYLNIRHD
jgi:lipid-A-disaccharide synthase